MNIKYSKAQYIQALTSKPLTEIQKKMLIVNYNSSNHTITASEMARLFKWENYSAANLHYGKLGSEIAARLGFSLKGTIPLHSIVEFEKPLDEWHWILNKELASAMEELGWVSQESSSYIPEEIPNKNKYWEGARRIICLNAYERDRKARDACIKHFGTHCRGCGLLLESIYGKVAKGIIHIHHKTPLHKVNEEYTVDPIQDLIPLCPNCHTIVHLSNPPYTIEELRELLKQNRH